MRYFEAFPIINYNDIKIRNLLARVKILEKTKSAASIYHPFTILDGETPRKIAYDYYGSTDYEWVIYLTNNIMDPYFDWPLNSNEFEEHMRKKYGSLEASQSQIIHYKKIAPSYFMSLNNPNEFQNSDAFDPYTINIGGSPGDGDVLNLLLQGYPNGSGSGNTGTPTQIIPDASGFRLVEQDKMEVIISKESYERNPDSRFIAVFAYDHELEKNELRRNIKLLDRAFVPSLDKQLKEALTEN